MGLDLNRFLLQFPVSKSEASRPIPLIINHPLALQ